MLEIIFFGDTGYLMGVVGGRELYDSLEAVMSNIVAKHLAVTPEDDISCLFVKPDKPSSKNQIIIHVYGAKVGHGIYAEQKKHFDNVAKLMVDKVKESFPCFKVKCRICAIGQAGSPDSGFNQQE